MGNISQRIDAIIEARKQRLAIIQDALSKVSRSEAAVTAFRAVQQTHDHEKVGMSQEAAERISHISFADYDKALQTVKDELERLRIRFSRDKINISFVGRAVQGKSLVLQKISGLGGTVIPSATGSDCTGAKSIITNTAGADKPYAEITFFTEAEMVEIINVYLKAIFGDTSRNIRTLDEVSGLSAVLNDSSISSTKEPTKRELRKYIDHMDILRENLGKRTCRIEEEHIEEYVAMYKSTDDSVKYFKYLSVKCADIHCTFPKKDAGKIILVDTIGMGSQSLGVGDSLMDTVKNDSDAVIYMQRPDPKRSHLGEEDTIISNDIVDVIREDCARKMMFWVLNHVSSGEACNTSGVEIVKQEFKEANYPVADLLTVDCISEEQVENKLLTPVLNTISQNIDAIDEIYLDHAAELMRALFTAYSAICDQVDRARAKGAKSDFAKHYRTQIEKTIKTGIQNEIRTKFFEYHKMIDEDCQPMSEKVEDILKHLPSVIPSKEYIVEYLNMNYRQQETYIHAMDIMRPRIIDAFLTLDETLSEETNSVKDAVIQILTAEDKGALGAVVPYQSGVDTPAEWIDRFIEKNRDTEQFDLIRAALESFRRFNVSVEGFLLHEIRLTLTEIDPSLQTNLRELPLIAPDAKDEIAECIIEYLQEAMFTLRQTIRKKAAQYYSVPNKAIFAAVKDFHDRISYARGADNERVDDAWTELYDKWCTIIWADDAASFNATREAAIEWNNAVDQLKGFDRKENFIMMK